MWRALDARTKMNRRKNNTDRGKIRLRLATNWRPSITLWENLPSNQVHSSVYPIIYIFYYNTIPLRTLGGNDAFGATSTLSPFTPIDDAAGAALVLELSAAAEDIAATEVASRNPPELVLAALVTVTVTVWISGDVRAPPPCANGFHIILTF